MAHHPTSVTGGASLSASPGISSRQGWYTVLLLSLLYIVSWVDRNILALLAQPVGASLGLSDRQLALLLGLGFALVYAIGGMVLGHFVDTRNRRTVVTVGVIIWSVATFASAFATNFETMFVLRCGVALGEAVLMPAGVSLIADLFRAERRGLPVAVFTSVGAVMTFGSFAMGAAAISLAEPAGRMMGLMTWQATLILVALPGFLLAAAFALTATVPPRESDATATVESASIGAMRAHLRKRFGFLIPLLSLTGLNCICSLAMAMWLPTLLIRGHGMSASQAGYLIGLIGVPAGIAGNFFWQWYATYLHKRDPRKGIVRTFTIPALLAAPCYAAGLIGGSATSVLLGFAGGMFTGTAFAVISPIAIQAYAPPQMRARFVSLNFLIISVLGYALGPLIAVESGAMIQGEGQGLHLGLIITCLISWPLLVLGQLAVLRNADGEFHG